MMYDMDSSKQLDSANSYDDYPVYQEPLLNNHSSKIVNTQENSAQSPEKDFLMPQKTHHS